MKSAELLKFLFVDSQQEDELQDYLTGLHEELDRQKDLEAKKAPLTKALKDAKVELGELDLELDPDEGWCLSTNCAELFNDTVRRLQSPEGMHALASAGWGVDVNGDVTPTDAEGTMKIHFTAITGDDEPDDSETEVELEKIVKDSFEFVNEPMPAFKDKSKENEFKKPKGAAVGKAESGGKPKKS